MWVDIFKLGIYNRHSLMVKKTCLQYMFEDNLPPEFVEMQFRPDSIHMEPYDSQY